MKQVAWGLCFSDKDAKDLIFKLEREKFLSFKHVHQLESNRKKDKEEVLF